ncbi:hypothetical protein J6590_096043 [Homalodisca vitripennis]|nr:hypothetical protein J6590_030356 [Homalodisca vitripennis]KAG8287796.1 hypothetical protein J6590_030359 [Homalodisca vitripennis]KAG8299630.1 hypothetical protein J6590_096043 [Homalodisca vitripennis]
MTLAIIAGLDALLGIKKNAPRDNTKVQAQITSAESTDPTSGRLVMERGEFLPVIDERLESVVAAASLTGRNSPARETAEGELEICSTFTNRISLSPEDNSTTAPEFRRYTESKVNWNQKTTPQQRQSSDAALRVKLTGVMLNIHKPNQFNSMRQLRDNIRVQTLSPEDNSTTASEFRRCTESKVNWKDNSTTASEFRRCTESKVNWSNAQHSQNRISLIPEDNSATASEFRRCTERKEEDRHVSAPNNGRILTSRGKEAVPLTTQYYVKAILVNASIIFALKYTSCANRLKVLSQVDLCPRRPSDLPANSSHPPFEVRREDED